MFLFLIRGQVARGRLKFSGKYTIINLPYAPHLFLLKIFGKCALGRVIFYKGAIVYLRSTRGEVHALQAKKKNCRLSSLP